MAKGKNDTRSIDYGKELRKLRSEGPQCLYLLWGPEDYLREAYTDELRKLCIADGDEGFGCRRFDGAALSVDALQDAVYAVPFLSPRTYVEVRGADLNRLPADDAARLLGILGDLPADCTLVFVMDTKYEPDGRLKLTKALRQYGTELCFTAQGSAALVTWVRRRLAAHGKEIAPPEAQHLILCCGGLMNRMIPELEKLAAYAKGGTVTRADMDAVVQKLPEAAVFEMTDRLAARDFDGMMAILAELLSDRQNTPIFLLSVIGQQLRRLYAARTALETGQGTAYVTEVCGLRYDFIAQKLLQSARRFPMPFLEHAVCLCAETDYAMKSTGADDTALLKDLLLRIALEG